MCQMKLESIILFFRWILIEIKNFRIDLGYGFWQPYLFILLVIDNP
jgi:hypothetical protein